MIHAYAIEPPIVVGWSELRAYRFAWDKFGIGTPRVLLEFPDKDWENKVVAAASDEGISPLRWKRLDELLLVLRQGRVRRLGHAYDGAVSWLENAEAEHDRHPFAAIIAMANPRQHSAVIAEADLGRPNDRRWAVATATTPSREAGALAAAVAAMLENCSALHIVDPHFNPGNKRHRVVIEALLAVARRTPALKRVTVHCKEKEKETLDSFNTKAKRMACRLPQGVTVTFKRWCENGGEKLHNRYLLTDLGGVTFGVGFDAGSASHTDDVNLMSREQYQLRWDQFAGGNGAFALVDEPQQIHGTSS